MPNYRWTLTCEETLDDGETVNVTTKTIHTDSEAFTAFLGLIPQLINGAGFRVNEEDFEYKGVAFEVWTYCPAEAAKISLENDGSLAGFRGAFDDLWPKKEEPEHPEYFPDVRTRSKYIPPEAPQTAPEGRTDGTGYQSGGCYTATLTEADKRFWEHFGEQRSEERPYVLAPDGVNRIYGDGSQTLLYVPKEVPPFPLGTDED